MDVVQCNDKEYNAWTRGILEKLGDTESDPILAVCIIVVAVRSGRFRISPYLNNTPEDIQTLIQGLKEVIKMES
jgi:selenocysteine lyase/cysteine desulfurase